MKKVLLLVFVVLILAGCDFSSSSSPKEDFRMTSSIKSSRFFTMYLDDVIIDKEDKKR